MANVLPYPGPRVIDRAGNTRWTQTQEARHKRAMVVACMPDVLAEWPADVASAKRADLDASVSRLRTKVVRVLKGLGLLSPDTASTDVDVARMVREAREWHRQQAETVRLLDDLQGLA